MEGRTRHLGNILPADGKVDFDPTIDLAPGLVGKPQEARHLPLD